MDYSIFKLPENTFLRESIKFGGGPVSILFDLRKLKGYKEWIVFGKWYQYSEVVGSLTQGDRVFIEKVCAYYGWEVHEVL